MKVVDKDRAKASVYILDKNCTIRLNLRRSYFQLGDLMQVEVQLFDTYQFLLRMT